MNKELAIRTIGYLIGHYKTHEETIINSQEIEAINYIFDENERLEQQCKKQKEVIDKSIEFLYKIKFDKTDKYICISEYIEYQQLLDILKEVSE